MTHSPLSLLRLEDRLTPVVTRALAVGTAVGATASAAMLDSGTDQVRFRVDPFTGFTGGVHVAVGDVTGDGVVDLVAAAGVGGGPRVRTYDGRTGQQIAGPLGDFQAFAAAFAGGVEVAVGDLNADGFADVVTGAGPGGTPHVRAFSGKDGTIVFDRDVYDAAFRGGVSVAVADLNGDGRDDIACGSGAGGEPHVRAFSGATGAELYSRYAFDVAFRGGVTVAAADTDGDGRAELVAGAGPGGGPAVKVIDTRGGTVLSSFYAGDAADRTGVRVLAGDTSGDGRAEVLAVGGSALGTFRPATGERVDRLPLDVFGLNGGFCACPSAPEADAVSTWNRAVLQAVREGGLSPPVASRVLAITHLAMFDAANGVSGVYQPYLGGLPTAPAAAQAEASAAAAAYRVLSVLVPGQQARWDRLFAAGSFALNEATRAASAQFGAAVGDAYLTARAADGSATVTPYTPGTAPGDWVPTPPANAAPLLPGWGGVTPFVVTGADQFAPPAPPDLGSPEYARDFAEVQSLGRKTGSARTAEQTEVATFWADGAGTVTPPGHWNLIAEGLCATDGRSVTDHARTFALLNAATADAAITAWAAKYRDGLWRPITAIQRADADGNAATTADPTWVPLLTTPPFPSYISGHSTFSGAAAAVLTAAFGAVSFRTPTDALLDTDRTFPDFFTAAAEAGQSRVYGGIHFQTDNTAGLTAGRQIGELAATLLPRKA